MSTIAVIVILPGHLGSASIFLLFIHSEGAGRHRGGRGAPQWTGAPEQDAGLTG